MRVPSLVEEFTGVEVGDARRAKRVLAVVETLQAHPDASYPEAFRDEAAREAFYRLVRNPHVEPDSLLSPHIKATVARASTFDTVLVIHDSSEVVHAAGSAGEDFYELQEGHHGYVAHVGLCVAFPERVPLGILHVECVEREGKAEQKQRSKRDVWKDGNKESLRWARGVEAAGELLSSRAIHVADREGDSYELLALFAPHRFVVRGAYDRRVIDAVGERRLVLEVGDRAEVLFCRKASLTSRANNGRREKKHPSRGARTARLGISAAQVTLRRPDGVNATNGTGASIPATLTVNAVFVREIDPPDGEAAVEWLLYTTEPVDTAEQVAAIVDIYRARWLIEEYFKALKTGCAFSRRQFESQKTSQTALALTLPMAWRLLLIRHMERSFPNAPASVLLAEEELLVLAALTQKPRAHFATVAAVTEGLARLGGHIKSNGPAGWQVLGRGWLRLLDATGVARALKR